MSASHKRLIGPQRIDALKSGRFEILAHSCSCLFRAEQDIVHVIRRHHVRHDHHGSRHHAEKSGNESLHCLQSHRRIDGGLYHDASSVQLARLQTGKGLVKGQVSQNIQEHESESFNNLYCLIIDLFIVSALLKLLDEQVDIAHGHLLKLRVPFQKADGTADAESGDVLWNRLLTRLQEASSRSLYGMSTGT